MHKHFCDYLVANVDLIAVVGLTEDLGKNNEKSIEAIGIRLKNIEMSFVGHQL